MDSFELLLLNLRKENVKFEINLKHSIFLKEIYNKMNNTEKKVKSNSQINFPFMFLSSKVYAQSQIYSNNYKDCMKENF